MYSDVISTAELFDRVRMEKMWPPGNALCALQIALLPRTAVPKELLKELVDRGLADDDWLMKGDGPCLVLGEGVMGSTGQYYPRPLYNIGDVVSLTHRFRAPQKKAEEDARKKDMRRRGIEQRSVEHNEHWRKSVMAKQEEDERKAAEARNATPLMQAKRITSLETEVEQLKQRLASLESQLGIVANNMMGEPV